MQMKIDFDGIDQSIAPKGMVAVLKSSLMSSDNICNHCDYRFIGCNTLGYESGLIPCMNYARNDGKCVLFKRV